MPILYIAVESHQEQLCPFQGVQYMDELQDALHLKQHNDSRRQLLLNEALNQCQFKVDPDKVGVWFVANEVEKTWMIDALVALNQALQVHGWPWPDSPPDPELWLLYFLRDPVVVIDNKTSRIDLIDHHKIVIGTCCICGCITQGLDKNRHDSLTASELEDMDEQNAKGKWWCYTCFRDRCSN